MKRSGSLVLLAWLDSTVDPHPTLAAALDGKRISPESAISHLFPDDLSEAVHYVPWLRPHFEHDRPICAYAAVTLAPSRMRSGFAANPRRADIDRLYAEFRNIAHDWGGGIAQVFDAACKGAQNAGPIEIRIFEGTASRGDRDIALSSGEFAILTAIALGREHLGFEEWCDRLWPDRDFESTSRLLRVYIHRIRTKFGTDRVIETHNGGYRIGADVTVDVLRMEELTRGVRPDASLVSATHMSEMQRAFDGFKERRYRRLACFEHFPEIERRLIAVGTELARCLAHHAFLSSEDERVLSIANHLVDVDPYDEVAAELHIRAQLRLGRPDAATRFFRLFCSRLRDELDLAPPHHLAQLIQA